MYFFHIKYDFRGIFLTVGIPSWYRRQRHLILIEEERNGASLSDSFLGIVHVNEEHLRVTRVCNRCMGRVSIPREIENSWK